MVIGRARGDMSWERDPGSCSIKDAFSRGISPRAGYPYRSLQTSTLMSGVAVRSSVPTPSQHATGGSTRTPQGTFCPYSPPKPYLTSIFQTTLLTMDEPHSKPQTSTPPDPSAPPPALVLSQRAVLFGSNRGEIISKMVSSKRSAVWHEHQKLGGFGLFGGSRGGLPSLKEGDSRF